MRPTIAHRGGRRPPFHHLGIRVDALELFSLLSSHPLWRRVGCSGASGMLRNAPASLQRFFFRVHLLFFLRQGKRGGADTPASHKLMSILLQAFVLPARNMPAGPAGDGLCVHEHVFVFHAPPSQGSQARPWPCVLVTPQPIAIAHSSF